MTEAPLTAAFIGLGVMGYPMAGHLAAKGHKVAVYNRTRSRAEAWAGQHGGIVAASPAQAAGEAQLVMTCVGADADLREVVLGPEGALAAMRPGAVLVDHTTASADIARALHAVARERGLGFLDAPVSGGQAGAEQGTLTIMVGGDDDDFRRAEPALAAYGRAVTLMGPAGSGQLTKMVNQICLAGMIEALAEGLNFAVRAGLDAEKAVAVMAKGAAQSWQMDNRAHAMLADKFDYGFAVDWMRKDLGMCLAEGARIGAELPITRDVDARYGALQEMGGGRWDTSSLMRLLVKTKSKA